MLARVMSAGAGTSDRSLLADAEARETAARSFLAATARGVAPMIEDYLVCRRDWGFSPASVGGRVHLWHGVEDRLVPIGLVRPLAAALPNCRPAFTSGDGHFFCRRPGEEGRRNAGARGPGGSLPCLPPPLAQAGLGEPPPPLLDRLDVVE